MKKILVVDNDKFFLEYLRGMLSEMGHEVMTANSGLYALDVLKTSTPDIVFVDLVMPNIDGKKLCKIIRGMPKMRDCFIAILSGIAAEDREIDLIEIGADLYIDKGPDIADKIAKIFQEDDLSSSASSLSQLIGLEPISSPGITRELLCVKRHLEVILEKMSEGILEITYDGKIVFANPSALKFLNSTDNKLLGSSFIDHFIDKDRKKVSEALNSIDNGPVKISYDSPVILNGYELTIDIFPIDDNVRTAVVIFNNVTQIKKWERSLRESKDLLNTFINSTNEAMLSITEDGLITIFNSAAEKMFGRKKEQTIGQPFKRLILNSHRKRIEAFFDEGRSHKKMEGNIFEVPALKSNGTVFPVELSLSQASFGNTRFVVAVARDITEQRAAEEEKWKLAAQLQHAQKMKTIGTLAGGIAHDFNNLLMVIAGNLEYMSYYIASTKPYYEELKNIEKQVWRGKKLTNQLLGFARMGKYNVKPLNLNRLIEESSETFGRTRKDIKIDLKLSEDLFAVEADEEQILQSLMNLYLNAGDAMAKGGQLLVKTRNVTHDDIPDKSLKLRPGEYVLVSVTDSGTGMDKETMNRLFEPFFTTKEVGKGTGLGLASVYGIVKGHEGYIFVDSIKGRGTTFSIYFPASDKSPEEPVRTAEPVIKGKANVLVVDDEKMSLASQTKMLELLGYTVLEARSGREAIDIHKLEKYNIDIIVLDMIMPEMNGLDVFSRLKETDPNLRFLLCSGYSMEEEWKDLLDNPYVDFLQKPFRLNEFSRKINDLLNRV